MPITHEEKTIEETGAKQIIVTFSNGSLEQLEELKEYLKLEEPADVLKMGISFFQKLKDSEDKVKENK